MNSISRKIQPRGSNDRNLDTIFNEFLFICDHFQKILKTPTSLKAIVFFRLNLHW